MNAQQEIINSLENIFSEMDAEYVAKQVAWALERKLAVREFEASDVYRGTRGEEFRKAKAQAYSIAGGKGWYDVFWGRSMDMIPEIVEKKCKKVIENRNASIAKKLAKAEVTEVYSNRISRTSDGFHGIFNVDTNLGPKHIEIETILAGGYNIQCLNVRTLVKVRK